MIRRLIKYLFFLCGLAVAAFTGLYYNQDWLMMRHAPLPADHVFTFTDPFEEHVFTFEDGAKVNALLFKADNPKGAVLYVHGRGGNLEKPWGSVAKEFTKRGYDTLIFDYRGFGKSTGKANQETFLHDALYAYDFLNERYSEESIVVYGVSFGSGIATYVASQKNPSMLLLEAPYYSMLDLIPRLGYMIPQWVLKLLIKFPLQSNEWIANVRAPIYIFHGKVDELIPYDSSERLLLCVSKKTNATLVTLKNGKHNYLNRHPLYQKTLDNVLAKPEKATQVAR